MHVVPPVPLNDQGEPNYSTLTNHKPGQLYVIRKEMHIAVLRTLKINASMTSIGIQDAARGVYTCVAINGQKTNSTEVTIMPSGEYCDNNVVQLSSIIIYFSVATIHNVSEIFKQFNASSW